MIITCLRIILLWISLFGICMFANYKFKIKKEFTLPITFLCIILILFLSSLLNVIKLCSILIFLFGLFGYCYLFIKKKLGIKFVKDFFDYKFLIIGILILFVTIISYLLEFTHYDNFSHWALLSKQLFLHNSLPSFEYSIDEFTTYPPASSLFIYFVGLIVGKTEHAMILGQTYLIVGLLSALTVLFKNKNKVLSCVLLVIFTLYVLISNVLITDLLVDTVLGVLGIVSVLFAYYYRDNIKKAGILLGIMSCVFIIFKNSGFLFIAMNVLLLLILGFRNKEIKKTLLYIGVSSLCVAGLFYLWQKHLLLVYYEDTGQITKHSISITNAVRNLTSTGYENTMNVVSVYLNNFFNIHCLINWYIMGINLFLILLVFVYKNRRKDVFKVLILCDVLYLLYWLSYGVLYVLSMPYEEAVTLACYNRYMMSCILVLFGIMYILVYDLLSEKRGNIGLIVLIVVFLLLLFKNGINSPRTLIGFDYYEGSERQQIQKIIKENDFYKYPNDELVVFMDKCSLESYATYVFRYELFKHNVSAVCGEIELSKIKDNTVIIVPDIDDNRLKQLNESNITKIDKNIFRVEETK